jgi:hypothetical protein
MLLLNLTNYIKRLAVVVIQSGGVRKAALFFKAERFEKELDYRRAEEIYRSVVERLKANLEPGLFKQLRYWQYFAERAAVNAGLRDTYDPIFACRVMHPPKGHENVNIAKVIGQFEAEWSPLGLRIDGFLYRKYKERLWIFLDGRKIRSIAPRHRRGLPSFFNYYFMREVVKSFNKSSVLEVRADSGVRLACGNHVHVIVETPHGNGTIFRMLDDGASVNKKGFFVPSPEEVNTRQDRFLELYAIVNAFFEKQFGRSIFILYGTLLGYYREGNFILGDDDFDAGYISTKQKAIDVKSETIGMVKTLVLAGFIVSFNRLGRLFRIRLPEDPPEVHLDLRPLWYEDGGIWAHLQAFLPLEINDFLPLSEGVLRGVSIKYPKNAEKFLVSYYGPGWKIPDPGYSNAMKRIPSFVRRKLASVCISPIEYDRLCLEIDKDRFRHNGAGKLISNGSHDLYPLAAYEADCEW